MNANLPTMAASALASSTYSAEALFANGIAKSSVVNAGKFQQFVNTAPNQIIPTIQPPKGTPMSVRRVVQVLIADPNENVSLADCLLYKGDEHLTDLTDQELFFELDIKDLLEKHNEKRTKVVDKKVKDRTEYLEPAKVRDLKMVVVTVASL